MKWMSVFILLVWLIAGLLGLMQPAISKLSYGCLFIAFVFRLLLDVIKDFSKEKNND